MLGESHIATKKQALILLMSSDQIARQVIQEALEVHGYVVITAGDLSGAVDWLGRCAPDLLIISPYLSCMGGHEAALYLRTKSHGLRVLMVSGFLDDDRLQFRSSLHLIETFPKPYTAEELIGKVSEVLATTPVEAE